MITTIAWTFTRSYRTLHEWDVYVLGCLSKHPDHCPVFNRRINIEPGNSKTLSIPLCKFELKDLKTNYNPTPHYVGR